MLDIVCTRYLTQTKAFPNDLFIIPQTQSDDLMLAFLKWNSVANQSVKTSYPCRPNVRGEVQNLCQRGIHSVSGTEYLCPPLIFGYSPARKLHRGSYLWFMSSLGDVREEMIKSDMEGLMLSKAQRLRSITFSSKTSANAIITEGSQLSEFGSANTCGIDYPNGV